MPEIAFVTTCKGRLHHLKQTLPLLLAAAPDEVIVVDYGCPQKTGDWVEANHPGVKVVRVDDDPGFCLARARNLGARAAKSEWLCLIDADVRVDPGWVAWMRANLQRQLFFRAGLGPNGKRDAESWGTVLCTRRAFDSVGGYDELFRGWGGEDDDFYLRLWLAGFGEASYPAHFVDPIRHDDSERVTFHGAKNLEKQGAISRAYTELKTQAMFVTGRKAIMPLEMRQRLMRRVEKAFKDWEPGVAGPLPSVSVKIQGETYSRGERRLLKTSVVTVQVDGDEARAGKIAPAGL